MGGDDSLPRRSVPHPAPSGRGPTFLVVARVLGPVGTHGEFRAQIVTDFPDRFRQLQTIYVGDNLKPHRIESVTVESSAVVLKLAGVGDASAAAKLRNADLHVPIEEAVPLPDGQYYVHQIVGLEVWTDTGRLLGPVMEVLRTGSNDVYVVRSGKGELLLPAIDQVVKQVDLPERRIVVSLLPGLEDEEPEPGSSIHPRRGTRDG